MAIQPDLEWFFSVFKDFLCKKIMKKLKNIAINKSLVSLALLVWHQWFYKSGLNIRFGLGAQYNSAEQFRSRILPAYNLTIGKSI